MRFRSGVGVDLGYVRGLQVGGCFHVVEDGWCGVGCGVGVGELPQLAEEVVADVVGGAGFGRDGVFGWRRYQAEGFVVDHFFDVLGADGFLVRFFAAREQVGGDLEAVKEHLGCAEVECALRYAAEDVADGELDGGAVFGEREGEAARGGTQAAGWAALETGPSVVWW